MLCSAVAGDNTIGEVDLEKEVIVILFVQICECTTKENKKTKDFPVKFAKPLPRALLVPRNFIHFSM